MANQTSFLNCTPHALNLYKDNELLETIPSSGFIARLTQEPQKDLGKLILKNGSEFPVISAPTFKEVEGLPTQETNRPIDIIVSMLVAEKLKTTGWNGRVYVPDTGPKGVVRDENGTIIGTKNLIQYV